jgi:hypothetical protein
VITLKIFENSIAQKRKKNLRERQTEVDFKSKEKIKSLKFLSFNLIKTAQDRDFCAITLLLNCLRIVVIKV